jgi:deoxycytidine triphosphate deaminase
LNCVSGVLSASDIKQAMARHEIAISPYEESNLSPVGYNFSFSEFIFSVNSQLMVEQKFDPNNSEIYCIISPHDTVLILSREAIWISDNYIGTFHTKVSVVSKGFGHISTTLDPNWEGILLFSLNNPTNKKIKIVIGKKGLDSIKYNTFVTLILYKLISPSDRDSDNHSSRLELLRGLFQRKNSKLLQCISGIEDMEGEPIQIGQSNNYQDRQDRITRFNSKYQSYPQRIENFLDRAKKLTIQSQRRRVSIRVAVVLGVIMLGIYAYIKNIPSLISLLALIAAILLYMWDFIGGKNFNDFKS